MSIWHPCCHQRILKDLVRFEFPCFFPRFNIISAFVLTAFRFAYSRIHSPTMMMASNTPSPRSIVPVAKSHPIPNCATLVGGVASAICFPRAGAMLLNDFVLQDGVVV